MPNVYGFNLLGPEVACIEDGCDARGPMHKWPEKKMEKHQQEHVKERATAQQRAARQRARDARRLAAQKDRENEMAYGGSDA
jgi:DNA invertase Pin-like site-specific DNA recombinase